MPKPELKTGTMPEKVITYKMIRDAVNELKRAGVVRDSYWMRCLGPDGKVHYIEGKSVREMQENYNKLWEDKA